MVNFSRWILSTRARFLATLTVCLTVSILWAAPAPIWIKFASAGFLASAMTTDKGSAGAAGRKIHLSGAATFGAIAIEIAVESRYFKGQLVPAIVSVATAVSLVTFWWGYGEKIRLSEIEPTRDADQIR